MGVEYVQIYGWYMTKHGVPGLKADSYMDTTYFPVPEGLVLKM